MTSSPRSASFGLAFIVGAVTFASLPSAGLIFPAMAAHAPANDVPLTLKILKIDGNKAVTSEDVMNVLPYHVGDKVTRAQLEAGVQKVADLYKVKNLGVNFVEKQRFVKDTVQFYLEIEERDPAIASAPVPFILDKIEFVGNKKIPVAEIEGATRLRIGAEVTAEAAKADTTSIQRVYQKHDLGVHIQPVATQPNHDNHVVLTYQITEE